MASLFLAFNTTEFWPNFSSLGYNKYTQRTIPTFHQTQTSTMSPLIRFALAINLISSSHTFRMFMKCLALPHTLLKWTLHSIFHHLWYPLSCTLFREKLSSCHDHVPTYVSREDEDCAVCLCKMEENEGKGPQVNGFSLFSRALASHFLVPQKNCLIFPFFLL